MPVVFVCVLARNPPTESGKCHMFNLIFKLYGLSGILPTFLKLQGVEFAERVCTCSFDR